MTAYEVDVDELTSVIAAMTACQQELVDLSADVESEVTSLHAEWRGLARDAHASSHDVWRIACIDMSAHLAALRDVADVARASYTAAVGSNVAMWEQLPVRVRVESGSYAGAADECRTANQIAALLTESLAGKLGGFAGMAGDDATSAEFAATYDEGARVAVETLTDLTHGFIGLGRLLAASGLNHEHAETASAGVSMYTGASLHDDDFVRVQPDPPPSSLGANPPTLGTIETLILDHIEGFVWPGADVDLLLEAGTAWRRTAHAVLDLESHCDIAASLLERQMSPEVPLVLDALAEVRTLVTDTAECLLELAESCEDYAAAVRATHDRTLALLAEIGQMVIEGLAISVILGGLTGGLGAGAAGAAALARIAAHAPRFHALLTTLRVTAAASATRVRAAREGLVVARTRAEKFARVRARDERGSVRMPGLPGSRKPGWLRAHEAPPGHTIDKHVGKTIDELAERISKEGRRHASSFDDVISAEKFIDTALTRHADEIRKWVDSGSNNKLVIDVELNTPTGITVMADGSVLHRTAVKVVLIPKSGMDDGWQLLTAFPN